MPHEFDPCETPIEGEVDKWGFTIKPSITDIECILICLSNAPCGIDKKQAERLVKEFREIEEEDEIEMQLEKINKLLKGKLQYGSTYDSMGNISK